MPNSNDWGWGDDENNKEFMYDGSNPHNEQLHLEAIERRRLREIRSSFGKRLKRPYKSAVAVARDVQQILLQHRKAIDELDK